MISQTGCHHVTAGAPRPGAPTATPVRTREPIRIVGHPTLPGPEVGTMLTSAPENGVPGEEPTAGDVERMYSPLPRPLSAVASAPALLAMPGSTTGRATSTT